MKTKILSPILWAILIILVSPQCTIETDPCEGVNCLNGGECDEGDCYCPDWYEGSNCGVQARSKYYGTYIGLQTLDNGIVITENPTTMISVGGDFTGVNFIIIGSGLSAQLTFPSEGNFTILPQQYGAMWVESGYGAIVGNRLQIIYYGYLGGYYTIGTYDGYR